RRVRASVRGQLPTRAVELAGVRRRRGGHGGRGRRPSRAPAPPSRAGARRPGVAAPALATRPIQELRRLRNVTQKVEPTPAPLPAQYTPGEVDRRRYELWLSKGLCRADSGSDKDPFCIVSPPPNVAGSLHVGHALDHTIQDTLVRRRRMQGYETLWLPGTD